MSVKADVHFADDDEDNDDDDDVVDDDVDVDSGIN